MNDIREKKFIDVKLIQTKISGDSWQNKLEKIGLDVNNLMSKIDINPNDTLFIAWGNKNATVRIKIALKKFICLDKKKN